MHTFSKLAVSLLTALSFTIPATTPAAKLEQTHPVVFGVGSQAIIGGATIQCTVACDSVASVDTDLAISASNSGLFSSLPSTVTVPQGESSVTFTVTLASNASGFWTLSANANGETVTSPLEAIQR
jgi:hypothetical protein